jgi:hypothetical protein
VDGWIRQLMVTLFSSGGYAGCPRRFLSSFIVVLKRRPLPLFSSAPLAKVRFFHNKCNTFNKKVLIYDCSGAAEILEVRKILYFCTAEVKSLKISTRVQNTSFCTGGVWGVCWPQKKPGPVFVSSGPGSPSVKAYPLFRMQN